MSDPASVPLPPAPPAPKGDATGGVIPYKNPHALIAYYLGVFSIIPVLGFIFGAIAIPLGISGLKTKAKHPEVRGSVHAWIGIIFGSLSVLIHVALFGLAIIGMMSRR